MKPQASRVAYRYLLGKPTHPTDWSGWQNYNTIGRREFITTLLDVMESRLPATWGVLKGNDPRFPALKHKWWSKGSTVDEKGVQGRKILHRGTILFIGVVGGTEMAIADGNFNPGKYAGS